MEETRDCAIKGSDLGRRCGAIGDRPGSPAIVGLALALAAATAARGAGLNTDVALTPPEGGMIVRAQWRSTRLGDDPTPLDRQVDLSVNPVTVVHGLTSDLSLLATTPIAHRDVEIARSGRERSATGVADIPVLAKYRFLQIDKADSTTRWAAIGGAEIPSYDEPFSSESLDPIAGTVLTYQRRNGWVDADLLYKANTADGLSGDDQVRADVAYSHRLLGGKGEAIGPWAVYGVAELNGTYRTDGSTELLGSPGLQLVTPQWVLEAGVQLPIHQEISAPRLERDWTTVLSVRYQF